MNRRPTLAARLLLLPLASLPAAASAQAPDLPEEQAARRALTEARVASAQALQALESYGRAVPSAPPTPDELRARALGRLMGTARRRAGRPAPAPPFDPQGTEDELRTFRQAILARLHALDPDRFQVEEEDDEELSSPPAPLQLAIIDVQELVFTPEDHVAPPVGLSARPGVSAGDGGGGVLCFDAGGSPTLGVGLSPDLLLELIDEELGPDRDDGSVEYSGGRLVLRLSAAAIERVRALLDRLGEDRGGLVDLEVRVYRMPGELFARLRPRATCLDDAAEAALAQAVTDGRATLLSSHRVVAHDGQRVHVRRGASRSFVADIEVDQTGVVPVLSPVVNVLNEGLVVELRPLVDRGRRLVLVDAALSLSRLRDGAETRSLEGIELELPQLEIARSGSSACVPLGRGALLGGVFKLDEGGASLASVVYVRPRLVRGR